MPGSDVSLAFPASDSVYVADDAAAGLTDRIASDPTLAGFRSYGGSYVLVAASSQETVLIEESTPGSGPVVGVTAEVVAETQLLKETGNTAITSKVVTTPAGPIGQLSFLESDPPGTQDLLLVPYRAGGYL